MANETKPTRSELIKLRKRIKLAKSGYNLLKKKRDGLILDFFELLKVAKKTRSELNDLYKKSVESVNLARVIDGDEKLSSVALSVKTKPVVSMGSKNIMGVVVPKIAYNFGDAADYVKAYGIVDSSAVIEDTRVNYQSLIKKIIAAAETETAMKKLLVEIEKTKRRVNALEFAVIPKMAAEQKFILMRLEEMERETTFRTKRIKK
jgi:V/A-type H+-transporting ATPase subunit D